MPQSSTVEYEYLKNCARFGKFEKPSRSNKDEGSLISFVVIFRGVSNSFEIGELKFIKNEGDHDFASDLDKPERNDDSAAD